MFQSDPITVDFNGRLSEGTRMNTDEKRMSTIFGNCFAKHSTHPGSSVGIRVHHLQTCGLADGSLDCVRNTSNLKSRSSTSRGRR